MTYPVAALRTVAAVSPVGIPPQLTSIPLCNTLDGQYDLTSLAVGIPASLEAGRLVAPQAGVLCYSTRVCRLLAGCDVNFYPPAPRKERILGMT